MLQARGAAYAHNIAGYFRLTFTLRQDYFELGLLRMEKALGFVTKHASVKLIPDKVNDIIALEEVLVRLSV